MVVLLAIAGSVGAVLISTGGEAVDDLEAAGPFSTNVTDTNCASITIDGVAGVKLSADSTKTAAKSGDCEFLGTSIGKGTCEIYSSSKGRGIHSSGGCYIDLT